MLLSRDPDDSVRTTALKLGFLNLFRGQDAGGLVLANTDDISKAQTLRTLGLLTHLYQGDILKSASEKAGGDVNLIIGHARAATLGNVDLLNTQPIEKQHVIGVHNGTIRHLENRKEAKSDSHTVYELLDMYDNASDIEFEDFYREIDRGAAALIWLDKRDNTINFLRNKDRPLYFVYSQNMKHMLASSEAEHLDIVCEKSHLSWKIPFALPWGKLVCIDLDTFEPMEFSVTNDSARFKKLTAPTVPYKYGGGTQYGGGSSFPSRTRSSAPSIESNKAYPNGGGSSKEGTKGKQQQQQSSSVIEVGNNKTATPQSNTGKTCQTPTSTLKCTTGTGTHTHHTEGGRTRNYIGPSGHVLSRKGAKRALKKCCNNCMSRSSINEAVYWFGKESEYICGDCLAKMDLDTIRMLPAPLIAGGWTVSPDQMTHLSPAGAKNEAAYLSKQGALTLVCKDIDEANKQKETL